MPKHEQESKALCWFLRHGAEKVKLNISKTGYVQIDPLIVEMQKKFPTFTRSTMDTIVKEDEKDRYTIDRGSIRCNQGHSIDSVKIPFKKAIPPVKLYHGTDEKGILGIQKTGIQRMKRHHVHLTDDLNTASSVGLRHGSEVIIEIDTTNMVKDKIEFLQSDNGVWLTNFVDIKYFSDIKRKK